MDVSASAKSMSPIQNFESPSVFGTIIAQDVELAKWNRRPLYDVICFEKTLEKMNLTSFE